MTILAFAESIQLFPDGTIFVHIALILLMIWVLNRTFFRPVNRVIESRERFKGGHNPEAEEILASATEKQNKYSQAMLAARSEGYELIEKERAAAARERETKVAAAREQSGEELAREKERLEKEAEATRAQLTAQAEDLAERISANILKV